MKLKLIDDWKSEMHRLWCIRISIAYGVFAGVAGAAEWFGDYFNPWFLLGASIAINLAIIPLSRLIEQRNIADAVKAVEEAKANVKS